MKKIIIMFAGILLFSNAIFSQQDSTTKDLTGKLEKMSFKEGENKIEKVSTSLTLYAQSKTGVITSYYVKNRNTGKIYDPTLSEELPPNSTARKSLPGSRRFCRVRYMIDGRIIDFIVVCSGQNRY